MPPEARHPRWQRAWEMDDWGADRQRMADCARFLQYRRCQVLERELREAYNRPRWEDYATGAVLACASRGEFTTDDVWELMEADGLEAGDRRAIGPVMSRLVRDGSIVRVARAAVISRRNWSWLDIYTTGESELEDEE